MKVKDFINELKLEVVVEADQLKEINGVYIGDLLSNVMSRANAGDIWITIQGHQNIIAVALLTDISAVIVAENLSITENAIRKAEEKGVNILRSPLTAYEIACRLCQKGI